MVGDNMLYEPLSFPATEGGQSHCKLTNNQLAKVRSKASKYSFDNDAAFYSKREKGDMPAEIVRCDVPNAVIGRILTILFEKSEGETWYILFY